MGRWSQRRRAGGGGAGFLPIACNPILGVNVIDAFDVQVTFAQPVDIADWDPTNFHDTTTGANGDGAMSQISPNVILMELDDSVNPGDSWTYDGAAPGVCSPQSGSMA